VLQTFEDCQAFIAKVGVATILPSKDRYFACLLWATQGFEGEFEANEAFYRAWKWKDELPEKGFAYAGRLFGNSVLLMDRAWLPAVLGFRGRVDVELLYEDGLLRKSSFQVYQELAKGQPLGRKELRQRTGLTDKAGAAEFEKACLQLERLLLITRFGASSLASGWDSNRYHLLELAFPGLVALEREQSEKQLRELLRAVPDKKQNRWLSQLG